MNAPMTKKYRAVETWMECYNERVSPWFDTAQEAANWCKQNGKKYDAILPAINWHELS